MNGASVPAALLSYRQFVVWRLIQKQGRPKSDKVPFSPDNGGPASVIEPSTWGNYVTAKAAFDAGGYNGIGFVVTGGDPFVAIDLDDAFDAANNQWKPYADATARAFPGAWEVSQSGKGLHGLGIVTDKTLFDNKRRKFSDASGAPIEVYTRDRFIAFGGNGWHGDAIHDWTDALVSWVPDAESVSDYRAVDWVDQPRPDYDGPGDDDELIKRACNSQGPSTAFNNAPSFRALWEADSDELGRFYPDDARPFDHSRADLALANALAWWTGCNPARMERLFNQSGLARGDERKTRLAIAKALSDPNRAYFSRAQRLRYDRIIGDDVSARVLPRILTLDQALAELIFIGSGSMVASRSTKTVRNHRDAGNEFAASKHSVDTGKTDGEGRAITKLVPVMKLWTESPNRLGADTLTWCPGDPEFCSAPEKQQSGDRAYNLWVPPVMLPAPSNWENRVTPFHQHVEYLIPVEAERTRFLRWVGHIFQRPGELPHTCYLMIATETGIGRGTLASILTRALRGYVAANMNIDALFGGFNGRISQKLLATVDEVREGNSANRYVKAEALKSKITEETRALNPKYGAQSVEKNCCRWLMFSNHMDALPFDNNDRRIIVIENPTWRAKPEWYAYLHEQMKDEEFIASVQHYFMTMYLTGFNPHEPAAINEAKRKALAAIESVHDKAAREFAERWPGDLATVSDLCKFMGEDAPKSSSPAMRYVIERAGMKTAGRIRVASNQHTVLIVRGPFAPGDLEGVANHQICQMIETAQRQFW